MVKSGSMVESGTEMRPRYAEVVVDIAAGGTDRVFHYEIPPELADSLRIGGWVSVPFGRRTVAGLVTGFIPQPEVADIKRIAGLLDPRWALTPGQVDLARWLAGRYVSYLPQTVRCFLPPGARKGRVRPRHRRLLRPAPEPDDARHTPRPAGARHTPGQRAVLAVFLDKPGMYTRSELARLAGVGAAVVSGLVRKGLLEEVEVEVRRDPLGKHDLPAPSRPRLTVAQAAAVEVVTQALRRDGHEVFLLHGVTGSGKTEVYLRAIEAARDRGRQSLFLVPEIALTPQTVHAFRSRFGTRVAVTHSALSAGERFDEWRRIRDGGVDVVVGARSAVFAPVSRLGLIVVDEEHEPAYKQEDPPRYHARDVAVERGRREGAVVILGSATPSLESFLAAGEGVYGLLELPQRVDGRSLPAVSLIDMREELAAGVRGILSRRLEEAIRERIARREQVLLFLNRRGYHTYVLCRECGFGLSCPHCAVSLTLHFFTGGRPPLLRCHHCRFERAVPATCPKCGGRRLRYFGSGTQQVEGVLRERFPGARVLRMDVDTTSKKGAHERIYHEFRRGEADILVGTQMVAKGWDIGGVTLVGVVNADTSLHLPDFHSAERTFQLLTQVAGRAGRGEAPGEVLIQTHSPDHYSIAAAARHDYAGFCERELNERRALGYPPYGFLVRIVVAHATAEEAAKEAGRLAALARGMGAVPVFPPGPPGRVGVLGPAAAPLPRLHGRYRWHLALKGGDRDSLLAMAEALFRARAGAPADVHVAVDVDPVSTL